VSWGVLCGIGEESVYLLNILAFFFGEFVGVFVFLSRFFGWEI
jgi:hypothetical protein